MGKNLLGTLCTVFIFGCNNSPVFEESKNFANFENPAQKEVNYTNQVVPEVQSPVIIQEQVATNTANIEYTSQIVENDPAERSTDVLEDQESAKIILEYKLTPQRQFVGSTVVKGGWINLPTTIEDLTFKLPIKANEDLQYDFQVDWGDGKSSEITSYDDPDLVHIYEELGTYSIELTGLVEGWGNPEQKESCKGLIDFRSYGDPGFVDLSHAFSNCIVLQHVSLSNLSSVSNMSSMFHNAIRLNSGNFNSWDTSSVKDMSSMFHLAIAFNSEIGDWDTSSVDDMSYMFHNASNFNQRINNWDVSSVQNMEGMFQAAVRFQQDLDSWKTSAVSNMRLMFNVAKVFNGKIGSWNTGKVENMSMMFNNADRFNQDVSQWDTKNVTNMKSMFHGANMFNQNLSLWNVKNVRFTDFMLANTQFNHDLSNWNLDSLESANSMLSSDFHYYIPDNITNPTRLSPQNYSQLIKALNASISPAKYLKIYTGQSGLACDPSLLEQADLNNLISKNWTFVDSCDLTP